MDFKIDWHTYETKFNGFPVSFELLPLTTEGTVEFLKFYESTKPEKELTKMHEREQVRYKRALYESIVAIRGLFEAHVRFIRGFTINGKEPTPADLINTPWMFTLVTDIVAELARRSRGGN